MLIVSPDVLEMQAQIYYGATDDKEKLKEYCYKIGLKQEMTLACLKEIDEEGGYIQE